MFAQAKRPKNRLILPFLVLAIACLSSSSALAQGSIFGSVTNSDATVPANGTISFFGYLDNTDEEVRIETSVGAGYDNGNWYDDFQNYLTEAPGNPYDYHFYNATNSEGFVLSKLIPNNSFQQENIVLAAVSWPAAVTGLAGHALSPSQVVIDWNGTPGVTYHVYRRLATSNGSFFRIDDATGSLAKPGTADSFFVDNTVDGVSSYHYLVIPQDGSGRLGPHSAILTINSANIEAPFVSAIVPDTGFTVGGQTVTIIGGNFDVTGATATIGGAALTSVTVMSPFELSGVTPAGAVGPANVVVTNTASGIASTPLVGGFYYKANTDPVLDPIGPKTVAEGGNLNFPVTASDVDGTFPALTTSALPANALFTDNGDGTGTFDFSPDFSQEGTYPVTFYASDGIATDSEVVTITVTHVNLAPVLATIGDQTVAEGNNLNFGVTATDGDGEIPALTTSTLPANASFVDNGDGTGTFDFNPSYTQAGSYPVTFYAGDGLAIDSEQITLTVTEAGNQPPVLDPIGPQAVAEGGNLNVIITASDPDATIPALSTSTLPLNATFVDNGDGSGVFDFSPGFTQAGSYPITFYAGDGVATDSEVVTVTVTDAGNQAPVLAPIGAQSVIEGGNLNVVVNASDPDGTTPALSTSTLPANATFVDNGDGSGVFDFNPDFTQAGSYPITFYAGDGVATDSEVVTVTVTDAGNQAPVLDPIGNQTVAEAGNLNLTVTASDPDATIPALSTSAVPANATFVDNLDGTGTFDFNPGYTQAGSYPLTFYASDGIAVDSEVISITVTNTNQDPVLDPIGNQVVAEGANLNVTVTASDGDGTIPALTTSTLPANATFVDNGDGSGVLDFNPDFTQEGTYPLTFYASDGIATDSETITITVTGSNLDPVLDPIGPQTVAEGANLNIVVTASDPDGTIPTLSTSTLPGNATFVDNLDGTGTFDFNPDFTQEGGYPVTFYASDGIAADSEVVTVTVTNTNQPPVLAPIGGKLVNEGFNLNFPVTASDADGVIPVLTTSTLPANATFVDNGDGTGTFDFTPDFTQGGLYPVTFYASDGVAVDSEAVTITVNEAGNQAPVLDPIGPRAVDENTNLNFAVTASDPDGTIPGLTAENLPVGATFIDNGDGTGTFDFTPDFTQAGIFNVTFIASDGLLADTEIVAVTVNDVNRPPILDPIGPQLVDEGANLNFTVTAFDPDATVPVMTTSLLPANATFVDNGDGSGVFDFTPDFTQGGLHTITFYAGDGIEIDSEVVTITVNDAGNQAPVLGTIGAQMVYETDVLSLTITASDPDGTVPTLSAAGLPVNATFADNLDGTGSFEFLPDYTQAGVYSVTFKAFDGVAVDSEVVPITVLNTNRPPVLSPIGPRSVTEGSVLSVSVLATDPDGTIPALSTSTLPANATFIDNGNGSGSFGFTPDFTQAGSYPVTFYADDGVDTDSELVVITVGDAGNQPPVLDSIGTRIIGEGSNLNFLVTASDPDGTIPILTALNLPTNATFVDNTNGTGTFNFTPDFTQAGVYQVTFITSDGVLADSEAVLITVTELGNQAPIIDSIFAQSVTEGDSLVINVSATDPEGQAITFNYTSTPRLRGVTLTDNLNGTAVFKYKPDYLSAGVYIVRIYATDNGTPSLSGVMRFTLTVFDKNQAPVIDSLGPFGVKVGKALVFTVTAHDTTAPDTGQIFLTVSSLPANADFVDNGDATGTFTFTPVTSQVGVLTVRFIAIDDGIPPMSGYRDVQITVVATNSPPVLASIPPQMVLEGGSLTFGVSATDPDGTIPVLSARKIPVNATFVDNGDGTGTFTFNPSFIQAGLYGAEILASDGFDVVKKTALIQVIEAGNQAPEVFFIGTQQIVENNLLEFNVGAGDPDSTIPALSANPLPAGAAFVDNGDGTGKFTWTPTFTQAGDYYVNFVASDGQLADTEQVHIEVLEGPNQPPAIDSITVIATLLEIQDAFFKVYTSDLDSVPPLLTTSPLPGGTFTDNGNFTGQFRWTTTYDDSGTYNIMVYATDPDSTDLVDSQAVTFTVVNLNRLPFVQAVGGQTPSVNEGDTLAYVVRGYDYDGDPPVLSIVPTTYENFVFVDDGAGTGTLTITPTYRQAGTYPIRFIATDGARDAEGDLMYPNDTGSIVQNFIVVEIDVGPILDSIGPKSVIEGDTLKFYVTASHPGGESFQIFAENLPQNTVVIGLGDIRSITFTPSYTQAGVYTALFYASDGEDADSEYVEITVIEAGNQAPYFESTVADTQIIAYGDSVYNHIVAHDPDLDPLTLTLLNPPANTVFVDSGNGAGSMKFKPDNTQIWTIFTFRFIATDAPGLADTMFKWVRVVAFMRGDSNSDGIVDIADVSFIISYIFRGGPAPVSEEAADVNSDSDIDVSDALFLVNYIFRNGPAPGN